MAVRYVKGDATNPLGHDVKLIVHICNDRGGWGAGFVKAISARWKKPEKEYRAWFKGAEFDFLLGKVQFVEVSSDIYVVNMVAQQGYRSEANPRPICYDALHKCLTRVAEEANNMGASVHMPRIGTGLAGGEWSEVEKIILETLNGVDVTVYDFDATTPSIPPQKSSKKKR